MKNTTTGQDAQITTKTEIGLGQTAGYATIDYGLNGLEVGITHEIGETGRFVPTTTIQKGDDIIAHLLMFGVDTFDTAVLFYPGNGTMVPKMFLTFIRPSDDSITFADLQVEEFDDVSYILQSGKGQVTPIGFEAFDPTSFANLVREFYAQQLSLALQKPPVIHRLWDGIEIDGVPSLMQTKKQFLTVDGERIVLTKESIDDHAPKTKVHVTNVISAGEIDGRIVVAPDFVALIEEHGSDIASSLLATNAAGKLVSIDSGLVTKDDEVLVEWDTSGSTTLIDTPLQAALIYQISQLKVSRNLELVGDQHPMIESGALVLVSPGKIDGAIVEATSVLSADAIAGTGEHQAEA